jgi:hypothetical protein
MLAAEGSALVVPPPLLDTTDWDDDLSAGRNQGKFNLKMNRDIEAREISWKGKKAWRGWKYGWKLLFRKQIRGSESLLSP